MKNSENIMTFMMFSLFMSAKRGKPCRSLRQCKITPINR